ncbi:hypothetical protein B0A55_06740 [Friedmanniomyces simplex]|uniref:Manganese/iron superoxide dismutase C-terminal domain-containing protein n=1 Tax=Friedmanniomyces simplex TaxID=329884 RepID=A0A4U0X5H2_9PEZI|nr:hypothetical protein B0A55_06740 [Friedmanniomyces simplex]
MITRRLARPSNAFSPSAWTRASLVPQNRRQQQQQRRALHHVPPLEFDETFKTKGIPGLISQHGYRIAWTDYQSLMVQKLNELTAGEPYEHAHTKDIALQFARDPMSASLFNHASMAHNNHYFFSTLSTHPPKLDSHPSLRQSLVNTFGSIDTLRTTMLDTASAMFGPGFVWLVWARDLDAPVGGIRRGTWRVLTTYLAGTPYVEAGYRQQGIDTNIQNATSYQAYKDSQPVNTVGAFGSSSKFGREQAKLPPGGTNVQPVLCVNTWEHVWLRDFGITGKRTYLTEWWDVIDWGAVEQLAPTASKGTVEFMRF